MLGVLGGMGPMATVDFMRKLTENTEAARDQDHLQVFVYWATHVPDRTAFILGQGADSRIYGLPCVGWNRREQASSRSPAIRHIIGTRRCRRRRSQNPAHRR